MSLESSEISLVEAVIGSLSQRGFHVAMLDPRRWAAIASDSTVLVSGPSSDGRVLVRLVEPDVTPQLELFSSASEDCALLLKRFLGDASSRATAPDTLQMVVEEARCLESIGWGLVASYRFVYNGQILLRRGGDGIVITLDWVDVSCGVKFARWTDVVRFMGGVVPARTLETGAPRIEGIGTQRTVKRVFGPYFRALSEELSD